MSYDIYFFKPRDAESVDEAYERVVDEAEEGGDGAAGPETEVLKERLAKALVDAGTGLERFVFDYAEVAKSLKTTEEDARRQFRHIELNGPEDGNGIQIMIEDDFATLTVPYWHQGDEASDAFDEIHRYARIFETEAVYIAYDPQLEKQIDFSEDFAEMTAAYTDVSSQLDSTVSAIEEEPKPWWKFW
jgi:hypothetical protein